MTTAEALQNVMDRLVAEDPVWVCMLGQGADKAVELSKLRDVDLLVVLREDRPFEREVATLHGHPFDISYIALSELEEMLSAGTFWLAMVIKARVIYGQEESFAKLQERAMRLWESGPDRPVGQEMNFIRFKITEALEYIGREQALTHQFHLLSGAYVTDVLESYFKLRGIWAPKPKKYLSIMKMTEPDIYEKIQEFYHSDRFEKKYRCLEAITDEILKPSGGKLNQWSRGGYPVNR